MKYLIEHTSGYSYSSPASLSLNEVILRPRSTFAQQVLNTQLEINPSPQHLQSYIDFYGNTVHHFMVQHPHDNLRITSRSSVATAMPLLPQTFQTPPWENAVALFKKVQKSHEEHKACRFLYASPFIPINDELRHFALQSFPPGIPLYAGALDLTHRIFSECTYDKKASTIDTTVEQVLHERRGVCQDFAHLAISCLRSLGLAARYVSGYLETLPPPGKPKLVGADASHAWFALYIPGFGWVDLDPTNNQPANETYITIAWGRDYSDISPIKGVVLGGGMHTLSVMVDVKRVKECC